MGPSSSCIYRETDLSRTWLVRFLRKTLKRRETEEGIPIALLVGLPWYPYGLSSETAGAAAVWPHQKEKLKIGPSRMYGCLHYRWRSSHVTREGELKSTRAVGQVGLGLNTGG